jgi:hypothetical protein
MDSQALRATSTNGRNGREREDDVDKSIIQNCKTSDPVQTALPRYHTGLLATKKIRSDSVRLSP